MPVISLLFLGWVKKADFPDIPYRIFCFYLLMVWDIHRWDVFYQFSAMDVAEILFVVLKMNKNNITFYTYVLPISPIPRSPWPAGDLFCTSLFLPQFSVSSLIKGKNTYKNIYNSKNSTAMNHSRNDVTVLFNALGCWKCFLNKNIDNSCNMFRVSICIFCVFDIPY